MKRTFSKGSGLVAAGTALIAVTYGLVRLAYGLYLPETQADLGFDAGVAGLISSGGSLAYVAGAVAGFAASARHPRGLVVTAGAAASIGAAGMALAPDLVPFALAAVLSSAGAGLASPALVRLLQRGLEHGRQARAQTVVNAGTGPGLVAAGLLASAVLPDWRLAWWAAVGGAIVAAGAVLVLDHRGSVARPSDATGATTSVGCDLLPPRSWFVDHRWVLVAALLAGAASAGVWNFGRTLLVDAGVAAELSVGAWVCLGVGGTAVIATARPLARLAPGTVWTLTLVAMAAGTAGLATLPGVVPVAFAACAAFGWAYTAATGALIAWTAEIDAERAASGTALLFVLLVLGQAVGAVVLGALVGTGGYGTALAVAALGALLAALPGLAGRGMHRATGTLPHERPRPRARHRSEGPPLDLFSPATFGQLELRNRVVMAPLTRLRSGDDGVPGDVVVEHYRQRASFGLITTEGTWPSQESKAYDGQPGIVTDEQVAGWKRVADAVHAEGGQIVMQVMHGGRVSHTDITRTDRIVAPSAIAIDGQVHTATGKVDFPVPHALTTDEVQQVTADIVAASKRAVLEAGLDGVEIHSANGYLLHEFLSPVSNVRTDEYGGTPENRARLAIETATAVAEAIGAGRVGIRLSPMHNIQDVVETDVADVTAVYRALVEGLAPLGLAYLSVLQADLRGELVQDLRTRFGGAFIANSGFGQITTRDEAIAEVADGQADAVAVGRFAIANPDLVERWQGDHEVNEPNPATFYAEGAEGYTDYPTLEHAAR